MGVIFLLLCFAIDYLFSTHGIGACNGTEQRKVICHINRVSWQVSGEARFEPKFVPNFCTHLVYNNLHPNKIDELPDPEEETNLLNFLSVRQIHPEMEFIISIQEPMADFWPRVAEPGNRSQFFRKLVEYCRKNSFDGFELDIALFTYSSNVEENAVKLVEFATAADVYLEEEANERKLPKLIYGIILPEGHSYHLNIISEMVDWIQITDYEQRRTNPFFLDPTAPLYYIQGERSIDKSVKEFLVNGAKPEKMAMVLSFMFNTYTMIAPDYHDFGTKAAGEGEPGAFFHTRGLMAYFEICRLIKDEGWIEVDNDYMLRGSYAYNNNQWVGFDNLESIVQKVAYAEDKNLGAIVIKSLDAEDFTGYCHTKPYLLSRTAANLFLKT